MKLSVTDILTPNMIALQHNSVNVKASDTVLCLSNISFSSISKWSTLRVEHRKSSHLWFRLLQILTTPNTWAMQAWLKIILSEMFYLKC